jgi:hypothetical protein
MCCFCKKKYILVVGNSGIANEQRLQILLNQIYKIEGEYKCDIEEYKSKKYNFLVYLGMDGSSFNKEHFRNSVYSVKTRIIAIICLENLNPRSNSLKGNLEELRCIFTSDELRKKLYVFFTFGTSRKASSLEKLREDVLDFNEMYELIGLFDMIGSAGVSLLSCCVPNKPYDKNKVLSFIRNSGLKPRLQPDDFSIEDVRVLRKENRLKKEFNSKRVWILDIRSKWTLNNIKF